MLPAIDTMPPREQAHPDRPNRKGSGRRKRVTMKHIKAAKGIVAGKPLGQALREAGYSWYSSRIPGKIIDSTPALVQAIKDELRHYEHTPAQRATLIRSRLVKEVLEANSRDAIRACEVAGKDHEVRLFVPEQQIGIFNMQMPVGVQDILGLEVTDLHAISGELANDLSEVAEAGQIAENVGGPASAYET